MLELEGKLFSAQLSIIEGDRKTHFFALVSAKTEKKAIKLLEKSYRFTVTKKIRKGYYEGVFYGLDNDCNSECILNVNEIKLESNTVIDTGAIFQ